MEKTKAGLENVDRMVVKMDWGSVDEAFGLETKVRSSVIVSSGDGHREQ